MVEQPQPQSKSEYLERQQFVDDEVRAGLAETQSEAGVVKLNKAMEKGKEREKWVLDKAAAVANRIGRIFSRGGKAVEKAVQAVLGADVVAVETQDWLSRKVGNAKDKFSDAWQNIQEQAAIRRREKGWGRAEQEEQRQLSQLDKQYSQDEKRWQENQKRDEEHKIDYEKDLDKQLIEDEQQRLKKEKGLPKKREEIEKMLRHDAGINAKYQTKQKMKEDRESQKSAKQLEKEMEQYAKEQIKQDEQRKKEQEKRERLRAKLLAKKEKISQMLSQLS